jgi:hypothetical protein
MGDALRWPCAQDRIRVAVRAAERSLGQVIVKRVAPFPPGATRSVSGAGAGQAARGLDRCETRRRNRRR